MTSRCCWGAISKTASDCAMKAVLLATRWDVVEARNGLQTGLLAVPVCSEHAHAAANEYELHVLDDLEELEVTYRGQVWLATHEDNAA